MSDSIWFFPVASFPDAVYDWQRMSHNLQYRGEGPRLTVWPFQGEQPLASGLAALLGEFFRWRGPDYRLLVTRFGQDAQGDLTWDSTMLNIAPLNFLPTYVFGSAQVWGELDGDTLTITFQNGADQQSWALTGELADLINDLIALVPQILGRLGIRTDDGWQPKEPLDMLDSGALQKLLSAWGELNIRYELMKVGLDEYSDALQGAIRRMQDAALIGSRFACWAASHALAQVACAPTTDYQAEAEAALVSLGSVYPRVAWPTIILALIDWEGGAYEHAAELLESAIEADPRVVSAWALLTLVYEEINEFERAETLCREAINGNVADPLIYYRLACLLLDHAGEDSANDESRVLEAVELLEKAELDGLVDPRVPLRLMDAFESLDDQDSLWAAFERVLAYDQDGSLIWQIVEDAGTYQDFSPGLEKLHNAAAARQSYELYAVLARGFIQLERPDEALALLPTLRGLAADDYAKSETAQLALEAASPDFEAQFGQILSDLDEGMIPDSSVLDFLHEALAKEPAFAEGAVALTESYSARDEMDSALLVLDQATELLPDHIELLLAKADLLWELDRDVDAEALLLDAEKRFPQDVALLSRLAEYYFELGNDDNARDYLERAEALDPLNPEYLRVQEHIAEQLSADDEEYGADESDE